ncbi:MAG TPA: hypothetical protein VMV80_04690 [Anaerolineales bacterium]|nr:hypothetical protein [Anaerolineales bacterium]
MKKKVVKKVEAKSTEKVKIDPVKLKMLDPKNGETKYWGFEPLFEKQPTEHRLGALIGAFNWYGRFFGRKIAKTLMVQYLDLHERKAEAKLVNKVDDSEFRITFCWLARISLRGLELSKDETERLEKDIQRLIAIANLPVETKTAIGVAGPNVQERMRTKAIEAGGELEGLLDEYIKAGAKANHNFKPMDELVKKNVMAQHVGLLVEVWNSKRREIEEALKGTDSQLVEGYALFTKTQLKNLAKFIETVLSDLNAYVNLKKTMKAPRKRKAVPVEKIVKRLKHTMAFKDAANKLNLVGVSPTKLHGASEAWVYDTKRRKMHHYVADDYSKSLTVKGNTVLGFDTKTSEIKMFRKPAEQIKEIMGSKPAARKFFKDVRAVSVTPKGRFNAGMIILKAF